MANEGTDGDEYDVNEAVVEEWIAETTAFDRVYEIVRRIEQPHSADDVAERARVSPTTARKHLRTLASAGEVTTSEEGGTTHYCRSDAAVVTEHAQALLDEYEPAEIAEGVAEMKHRIREWREEYGVDSWEAFARELDVVDADSEHGAVLTEWQTTRRNLALAEAALAIGEASRTGGFSERTDDGDDPSVVV